MGGLEGWKKQGSRFSPARMPPNPEASLEDRIAMILLKFALKIVEGSKILL